MKPYENISKNPHAEHVRANGGIQRLYRFENGRGASIISQADGLWELTWIIWAGNDYSPDKYINVQVGMNDEDVDLALGAISACSPVKRTH